MHSSRETLAITPISVHGEIGLSHEETGLSEARLEDADQAPLNPSMKGLDSLEYLPIASYLELVQLTEMFILEELAGARGKKQKASLLPAPPQMAPQMVTTPPKKEQPIREAEVPKEANFTRDSIEKAPPQKTAPSLASPDDLSDIHKLIQMACPSIKLHLNPMKSLEDVLILIDAESAEEKCLLENMSSALKKQGFSAKIIPISDCSPSFFLNRPFKAIVASKKLILDHSFLHPLATRDSSGQPLLCKIPLALIPDLQLLLQTPSERKKWWDHLMHLLH